MLDMLSLGLPLDLPTHLAVQLPCLVLLLRHMHTCCDLPVSMCSSCMPVYSGASCPALHLAPCAAAALLSTCRCAPQPPST